MIARFVVIRPQAAYVFASHQGKIMLLVMPKMSSIISIENGDMIKSITLQMMPEEQPKVEKC